MNKITELSKIQIATAQLNTSIELYLDKKDLISALTLAGAAEEILGKLIKSPQKNSFKKTVDRLCQIHEIFYAEKGNEKIYGDLKNKTRNEFKHLCLGNPLKINLDNEAAALINRAIDNFKKIPTPPNPDLYIKFKNFENTWLQRNQLTQG